MAKKKHILLISQYFHPETFRVNDMACEWVKRGYKVTVLTGIPNYPMGKYFEGYDRKHRTRETWNGVNIIRIPLIARGNSSNKLVNAAGMAANYLSFVASGRKWVRSREAAELHADLVFTVEVSPMTQALIGVWYGKRYHVPTYLYVQDLWPENVETVTGIHNRLIIGPIDRMVDHIYRNTDEIFTTSPSFVKAIVRRKVRVPQRKVHYWPQYAEEFYKPLDEQIGWNADSEDALSEQVVDGGLETSVISRLPKDGTFKIAFTGNIGTAQGLDILPKVAELLKAGNGSEENCFDENVETGSEVTPQIRFVIVGDGRYQPTLEEEIRNRHVEDMFVMIERQPAEKIPEILGHCDAAFLSFADTKLWEMTIPAKLQSYMACGMPVIAAARGETERVIREAGCGVCCDIGDAQALAEAIREMTSEPEDALRQMRKNSRRYAEKHYDKKTLMDKMERGLLRVIDKC